MPFKCLVIFTAIALFADFFFEFVNLLFIIFNPHFEAIYPLLFGLILIPILVAGIFFICWLCNDSKATRNLLPIGLIMSAIASFLLFVWILVYIEAIYPQKAVYLSEYEKGHYSYTSTDDPERRTSKANYLLDRLVSPLIGALFYWLSWCIINPWVKRNANQDKSYDRPDRDAGY